MKSRGYDKLQILLIDSNLVIETLNFSFQYEALNEYDMTKATRHAFRDGSKGKLPHYVNLEWELDLSSLLNTDDEQLITKIKNAEFDGKRIILIPHSDLPIRNFTVQILENGPRKLGEYKTYFSANAAHKDYIIWFENKERITRHSWDPSDSLITVLGNEILVIEI